MNTRNLALSLFTGGALAGGLTGCGGETEPTTLSPLAQLVQALGLADLIAPNGVGDRTIAPNGVGRTTELASAAWGSLPEPNGVGGASARPDGVGRSPALGNEDTPAAPTQATCDDACDKIEACDIEVRRCGPSCRDLLEEVGAEGQGLLDCIVGTPCDFVLNCVSDDVIDEFSDESTPRAVGGAN